MHTIGIDLGGTKMSFGIIDDQGNLTHHSRIPTQRTWDQMKTDIVTKVNHLVEIEPNISSVGFGVAGLVSNEGYVYYSPNIPAFDNGEAVYEELSAILDLPLYIDNDNNCAGFAEVIFGKAKGFTNVLAIGLGTGIGGAVITKGKIMRGAHGFAGELGHWTMDIDGPICACGQKGCYEALASGTALGQIAKRYSEQNEANLMLQIAGDADLITAQVVNKAINQGDSMALNALNEYANNVSRGLVSLTNIIDPDAIVLSGGVVVLGDLLLNPVSQYFLKHIEGGPSRPMPSIFIASLGQHAAVIGAGAYAMAHSER